ncbi:hypothetical protein TNCV_2443201 [Trichonephila clavipes]|nr:hypothetical protein TNCV_2443201 [Trichonephila clavipes]
MIPAPGECTSSAMVKIPIQSLIKKRIFVYNAIRTLLMFISVQLAIRGYKETCLSNPQILLSAIGVYIRLLQQRGAVVKSNTTPNHDTGCRTSKAMHNATAQQPLTTVSPNSNPTIVMLLAEMGIVSKHNAVPFRCPCPVLIVPLDAQTLVISCQGK